MKLDSLARNTPMAIRQRASKVRVTHLGVDTVEPLGLTDLFSATSSGENHLCWVYVDPTGDCKVSCACGMFTYTLEVALASKGASVVLYSNGERPDQKNPLMRAYLCKHLYKIWMGRSKYGLGYHPPEEEEELEEEELEEEPKENDLETKKKPEKPKKLPPKATPSGAPTKGSP